MAEKGVNIQVINNPLGIPVSADGIMSIVIKAVPAGTFLNGTPYLLTQLSDLTDMGLDAAYDTSNDVAVYQQVSEFYGEAGDGALLWLYGIDSSTAYVDFFASDAFKDFVRNSAVADPLNKIKGLGACYDVPVSGQSAHDFPLDVTDSIAILQTTLEEIFNEGFQLFGVIDGYNMSTTATTSTLTTLATESNYKVGVCISGSKNNRVSSVGAVLGRCARITVGTSIGEVANGDGALTFANAYLTNQTDIATLNQNDFKSLGNKQYIFLRTWQSYSGYFWNDGATACAVTKPFSTIEYNRVANKLADNANFFFTGKINAKTYLDKNGDVESTMLNGFKASYNTAYVEPLINSGDVSSVSLTITGKAFATNKKLTFALKILPAPSISTVEGTVEFVSQL